MLYNVVLFYFLIKHYSIFNRSFLLYNLHIDSMYANIKKICIIQNGGAIVLKTKIGAILLIVLSALGFSETMAAQELVEEHTRRKTHGPLRSNANTNRLKRHNKSINQRLNCFQK